MRLNVSWHPACQFRSQTHSEEFPVSDRGRTGFTVIEVIMVVVIIGLLAGVAIPKLNPSQYRMNAGVRTLASILTRAQRTAVTQQYNVNVLFITADNAVKIHEDEDNDNVIDPTERVRQLPIGENVEYGQGGATVIEVEGQA